MSGAPHPDLDYFLSLWKEKIVLAQVLITRVENGFDLRHAEEASAAPGQLKSLSQDDLLSVAQETEQKAFRPLRSAPNLQTGWRYIAATAEDLRLAIQFLYPGALPDLFAARSGSPPVTHYREFTARQTGMYRIATMLTDTQAASAIRATCQARFCLKRRLWTVNGLAIDGDSEKSLLPCLEPCPIMLEFARKAMRIEQEETVPLPLSPSDLATLRTALETALRHPDPSIREADFSHPGNPRRLQLLLEKLPMTPSV